MNTGLAAVAAFFGWEGNRGSGMTLTLCHGLRDVVKSLRKGDEHYAYTPMEHGTLSSHLC